jgi:hypothetical protein
VWVVIDVAKEQHPAPSDHRNDRSRKQPGVRTGAAVEGSAFGLHRNARVRCPDHDEQPAVRVVLRKSESIEFELSGCCEKLIKLADARIK